MDKFQTPEAQHEENWWYITTLAYTQLYVAKGLTDTLPNPWEKYLPEMQARNTSISPSQTQKSFGVIANEIGTPASAPKPRGKPLGRSKGYKPDKRKRHAVIKKSIQHEKLIAA